MHLSFGFFVCFLLKHDDPFNFWPEPTLIVEESDGAGTAERIILTSAAGI